MRTLKVNAIDTSACFFKNQKNTDKSALRKKIDDADKKIPDTKKQDLLKTDYIAKITRIEGKIPSITDSGTAAAAHNTYDNNRQ